MRPRTLLALALVVAALGAFIVFFERDLPSTDERRQLDSKALPFEVDDVIAIAVERGDSTTRLARSGEREDEWRLTGPLEARADAGEIGDLLGDLQTLEKLRTLADVAPEDVGLDTPRLLLSIETAAAKWTVKVGSKVPATDDVVIAVDHGAPVVTSSLFIDRIDREPGAWRDRKVVPGGKTNIQRISVSGPGGELVLVDGESGFLVQAPVEDDANGEQVLELLTELAGLEARTFIDGNPSRATRDPKALGLDSPEYLLTVTLVDREEPLVIGLAGRTDEAGYLYASADGQIFTVDTKLPEILNRPAVSWQSLAWSGLRAFEVDAVMLTYGETASEFKRQSGEWRRDGEEISYTSVGDFLDAIAAVRAERLTGSIAKPTEAEPAPVVILEMTAARGTEVLKLWQGNGSEYLASRDGRGYRLDIAPEVAQTFLEAATAVLEVESEVPNHESS